MYKNKRLTIRLSIIDGESLSGYIMRSARYINVDCMELLKYIILNYNIHYAFKNNKINIRYSKIATNIDIFPFGVLRENSMFFLFNKSKEEIENATFKNIFDILNMNYNSKMSLHKMYCNTETVKDIRKFCPLCLKENGIYKLMWQIKQIEICDIHKIKLISKCGVCNSKQRYFSSELANYRCSNCNSLLWENVKMEMPSFSDLNKQNIAYANWRFLLKYKNKLVKPIANYNFEQSLAITMLYIDQSQKNIKNLNEFSHSTIRSIVRFINNIESEKYISLTIIIRIASNANILLSSLPNIEVPMSYVQSLIIEKKETKYIPEFTCLSPWCSSFGSNGKIFELGKYYSRTSGRGFINKYICTECYMRFDYNSMKNICEPLNKDLLNAIPKVKKLFLERKTEKEIINSLKIKKNVYIKIVTYLFINYFFTKPINVPSNIEENFEYLLEKNCLSSKSAKSLFGWNDFAFYYYYWSNRIQNLLMNKGKHPGISIMSEKGNKRRKLKKELLISMDYLRENDIDIRYENINKYFHISQHQIIKYELSEIIKISDMVQKSERIVKYDIEIIKKVINYLHNSINSKVSWKELCTETQINKYYFEKYSPNLKKCILRKIAKHNSKIKEQELEYYKTEIKQIYLNGIENGKVETLKSISSKLCLRLEKNEYAFISARPELKDFTKKLLKYGIYTESDK